MSVDKKLMTVNEAAAYLGLSVHTLYSWTSQRKVPFVKLGSRVRFDRKKLDAWVDALAQEPIIDGPSKLRGW
jgi:excisionase family DNA binding protein